MKIRIAIIGLALLLISFHAHRLSDGRGQSSRVQEAEDLEKAIRAELGDRGDYRLDANRFDLVITGYARSAQEKEWVEAFTRESISSGRGRIRNDVDILRKAIWSLDSTAGVVELKGDFPTGPLSDVLQRTARMEGIQDFKWDEFFVSPRVTAAEGTERLLPLIPRLLSLSEESGLKVENQRLTIWGQFPRRGVWETFQEELSKALPEGWGLEDRTRVRAEQRAILELRRSQGVLRAEGTLPDWGSGLKAKDQLESWVGEISIDLAPHILVETWMENGLASLERWFATVEGDALLAIRPEEIEMKGQLTSPEARKELLAGWETSAEWAGRELVSDLAIRREAAEPEPWWLKLVLKDGQAEISGIVDQKKSRRDLEKSVVAEAVRNQVRVVEGGVPLPPWWGDFLRMVDLVSSYAESMTCVVKNGGAIVLEGRMRRLGDRKPFDKAFARFQGLDLEVNLTWPAPREPFVRIYREEEQWAVAGEVGRPGERKAVLLALEEVSDGEFVRTALTTSPEVRPNELWVRLTNWWFSSLDLVPDLEWEGGDGALSVRGEGRSEEAVAAVRKRLRREVGNWTVTDELTFLPQEPSLRIFREDRSIVLEGEVSDFEMRASVEGTVRRSAPSITIRNRISIRPEVTAPAWMTTFIEWWPSLSLQIDEIELSVAEDEVEFRGQWSTATSEADVEKFGTELWEQPLDFSQVLPAES
ncbi:MAG: hypothetical protein AAGJ31_05640 [Verrucomicrobiota bacterium]